MTLFGLKALAAEFGDRELMPTQRAACAGAATFILIEMHVREVSSACNAFSECSALLGRWLSRGAVWRGPIEAIEYGMLLLVVGHPLPCLGDLKKAPALDFVRRSLSPQAGFFSSLAILSRAVVYG